MMGFPRASPHDVVEAAVPSSSRSDTLLASNCEVATTSCGAVLDESCMDLALESVVCTVNCYNEVAAARSTVACGLSSTGAIRNGGIA